MELDITGPKIYFDLWGVQITETIVNMWIVMAFIFLVCILLTRNLKTKNIANNQAMAELIVVGFKNFIVDTMGSGHENMVPFIGALFLLSMLSSLLSIFGMHSPTSDLSTTLGWSVLIFVMIITTKIKTNGFKGYLKGFAEPIFVLTPFNIIGEVATPVSMAFRHFGNIASGGVIMGLLYSALAALSNILLGWLPGKLSGFPLFQIGIPAVLSVYFDVFSSVLQAYIFCMLTAMYLATAGETE